MAVVFRSKRPLERVVKRAVDSSVLTRFMPLLTFGVAMFVGAAALSVSADSRYESVTKDAAFRASLELPGGAAFVSLSEGVTYYRLANGETCTTADVLVHGFSVPSYIWDPTYDFLASKGRCVVTLDLYGRGFSDNPDVAYTDELFATQVLDLLDHLKIKKATLLGLSNGGRTSGSQCVEIKSGPERLGTCRYITSSPNYMAVANVSFKA